MKAGIYMLLKDIITRLLRYEGYECEIVLYDNDTIEIKYKDRW